MSPDVRQTAWQQSSRKLASKSTALATDGDCMKLFTIQLSQGELAQIADLKPSN